eukprot:TRINITY_DN3269_c0_g1_i6.p2 TRINITY_DN3269_c0_g1~~TRINITY_DN3269_c0_g1_i6.p2  ORF type:complete len:490 (+),score=116.07 TRINITY_DN3269_c0_g1_i6:66-1535(+)
MAQPPALKRAATQSSDLLLPPAKRPRISSRRSSSSALIGHAQLGDLADQEIALVAAFLRPKDVRSFSQVSKRFRWLVECDQVAASAAVNEARRTRPQPPPTLDGEYIHEASLTGWVLHNYLPYLATLNERLKLVPKSEWEHVTDESLFASFHVDGNEGKSFEQLQQLIETAGLWAPSNLPLYEKLCVDRICEAFPRAPCARAFKRLLPYCIELEPRLVRVHGTVGSSLLRPRKLTKWESSLFKLAHPESYTAPAEEPDTLVVGPAEWAASMDALFHMDKWRDILPWHDFLLVGGSVLRCLLRKPFASDTEQDLDFFAINMEYYAWENAFKTFVKALKNKGFQVVKHADEDYVKTATVTFAPGVAPLKMQFIWYGEEFSRSRCLNVFDLDPCMVGFDGKNVLATPPFFESIATGTCINYKMVNNRENVGTFVPRTCKYVRRGFSLLVPTRFDMGALSGVAFHSNVEEYQRQIERMKLFVRSPPRLPAASC